MHSTGLHVLVHAPHFTLSPVDIRLTTGFKQLRLLHAHLAAATCFLPVTPPVPGQAHPKKLAIQQHGMCHRTIDMGVDVHADAHVAAVEVCGFAEGGATALTADAQGRLLLHPLSTYLSLAAKFASVLPLPCFPPLGPR